jgi:hypothetical protein
VGVQDVVDVGAGRNSSVCVSLRGVVTAWGAVTGSGPLQELEELKNRNIFRVSVCDRFVVGISDLGRAFVWHAEALSQLSIAVVPNPAVVLRSASIFSASCTDSYVFCFASFLLLTHA